MKKQERERKYNFTVVRQKYNGIQFRSRLEARWAVWFDAMGIPYVYEPEGVCLWGGGGVYLPDYYLPRHHGGVYAEVKPDEFTDEEKKKCRMLCRMAKRTVVLLDGAPEPIAYPCYAWENNDVREGDIVLHAVCTRTESRFLADLGYTDRRAAFSLATIEALESFRAALGAFTGDDSAL